MAEQKELYKNMWFLLEGKHRGLSLPQIESALTGWMDWLRIDHTDSEQRKEKKELLKHFNNFNDSVPTTKYPTTEDSHQGQTSEYWDRFQKKLEDLRESEGLVSLRHPDLSMYMPKDERVFLIDLRRTSDNLEQMVDRLSDYSLDQKLKIAEKKGEIGPAPNIDYVNLCHATEGFGIWVKPSAEFYPLSLAGKGVSIEDWLAGLESLKSLVARCKQLNHPLIEPDIQRHVRETEEEFERTRTERIKMNNGEIPKSQQTFSEAELNATEEKMNEILEIWDQLDRNPKDKKILERIKELIHQANRVVLDQPRPLEKKLSPAPPSSEDRPGGTLLPGDRRSNTIHTLNRGQSRF